MALPVFLAENGWALLFYAAMILVIVLLRKKIEWQTFGIGLYKTKVGLKLMEKLGTKYRGWVQILGYIGLGIGFIGMLFIAGNLVYGLWTLLFKPAAPAVVSPVIPGISIPGAAIKVPLITGWIALFIVIVIHEFSHGVVSRAHNVPDKSSGLLIFGPIGGAFVEPDEKKLVKQHETVQYSLFAAGPFSNIITALVFLAVLAFALSPLLGSMTTPSGVVVQTVTPNYPAANASIQPGMVITSVNNIPVKDYTAMSDELDKVAPGETVSLGTDKGEYVVKTIQNPTDSESKKGYLGVTLKPKLEPKITALWYSGLLVVVRWLADFFQWLIILSLGIGLANLLPLGPVDGGRMLQLACRQITGSKARGDFWWKWISLVTFALIIVLLIVPIGKAIFFA
jgi:membrane-associated protease RseP (regulator of RpoE activity)